MSGRICVDITSLSPFVLARRENRYSVQILHDTSRAFRAGSTAPLKVRLFGSNGANVSSSAVVLTAKHLVKTSDASSAAVQDAGNANPDSTFRYDPQLAGYIFNLQTKGLAPGSYEFKFKAAGDPRLHAVPLQIR